MRKRRKTRYIWLPMLGAEPNGTNDQTETNTFAFSASTDVNVVNLPGSIALFPLVEDTPQEAATTANPDPNLADFIGTDYIVKRLVGKVHLALVQTTADTFFNVCVTAGFFVARADDQNPLTPNGATTQALAKENFSPNYVDTIREPWMWRRTWILSNPTSSNGDAVEKSTAVYPKTNADYGSVLDGPHIDAKVARRIRTDERLWFVCSAHGVSTNDTQYTANPTVSQTVFGHLDIRGLGALRRAKNRSNF